MSNRIWLPEEDAVIRSERAKHVPVPLIAERLGRPIPATYLRARKLGCLVQPKTFWSPEEEERCRALLLQDPAPTDRELAQIFNRTIASVRWKVKDLGLLGKRALGLPRGTKVRRERRATAKLQRARERSISQQENARDKLMRAVAVQVARHLKSQEHAAARLAQRDAKMRASLLAKLEKGLSQLGHRLVVELKASQVAAAATRSDQRERPSQLHAQRTWHCGRQNSRSAACAAKLTSWGAPGLGLRSRLSDLG